MRPRRTHNSTHVFTLEGGTEDNDLWAYFIEEPQPGNWVYRALATVWVPTDEERIQIASGSNIRLLMAASRPQPVGMDLTDEPIGKKPESDEDSDLRST